MHLTATNLTSTTKLVWLPYTVWDRWSYLVLSCSSWRTPWLRQLECGLLPRLITLIISSWWLPRIVQVPQQTNMKIFSRQVKCTWERFRHIIPRVDKNGSSNSSLIGDSVQLSALISHQPWAQDQVEWLILLGPSLSMLLVHLKLEGSLSLEIADQKWWAITAMEPRKWVGSSLLLKMILCYHLILELWQMSMNTKLWRTLKSKKHLKARLDPVPSHKKSGAFRRKRLVKHQHSLL